MDRSNVLRNVQPRRRIAKGALWLLLKNCDSLRRGEYIELDEVLAANHRLVVVYVLRDAITRMWARCQAALAELGSAGKNFYYKAPCSDIKPLRHFARIFRHYRPRTLAHRPCPLGTNLITGTNNKFKVIKCMAYGFYDVPYLLVKTPPPEGGGFGLRLKAGLIGPAADCPPVISSAHFRDFYTLIHSKLDPYYRLALGLLSE